MSAPDVSMPDSGTDVPIAMTDDTSPLAGGTPDSSATPAPAATPMGAPNLPQTSQVQNPVLAGNAANGIASQDDMMMPRSGPGTGAVDTSWKRMVVGALSGMMTNGLAATSDRGRPSFLTGLGSGARAGIAAKQQGIENQQNQQKLQFESVQAADNHIRALDEHTRANQLSDDDKLEYRQKSAAYQATLQNEFGIEPDLSFNDSHPESIAAMNTTAQSNGGTMPPVATVQQPSPDGTHGTISVYSPSNQQMQQNSAGYRDAVNTSRRIQGLPDVDGKAWTSLGFKGQRDASNAAIESMKPTPSFSLDKSKPDYLPIVQATREQQLAQYQAHKDANGNPDANPAVVKQLQAGIDFLKQAGDRASKDEAAQVAANTTAQQNAAKPIRKEEQEFQTILAQKKATFESSLSDAKTRNVEADKMTLKEDETRNAALKNIGDLQTNLDQAMKGNEVANATAQVKFAEHEIVEGGVKRLNKTELDGLTTGAGSYLRQTQAWYDKGKTGDQPVATTEDMREILAAEAKSQSDLHDKNVAGINALIRPQSQRIAKGPAPKQPSSAVQALINKHAGGQ